MRVNNSFTNLIGFMVVLFSGFFTKLVSAQEEMNDDEDDGEGYYEPSGDCSDEDPDPNCNPLDNDFDLTKWLIIGGSVGAVVIGVIVILAIKKINRGIRIRNLKISQQNLNRPEKLNPFFFKNNNFI